MIQPVFKCKQAVEAEKFSEKLTALDVQQSNQPPQPAQAPQPEKK